MARSDHWDVDVPFYIEIEVAEGDIDRLDHVNNSVYAQYMERAAWAHTLALGLDWAAYVALDAACVVRHHELDYLLPARFGDRLQVATWISENDARVSLWRGFQMRRVADGRTVFRARTQYVTVRLSNGRPCRMPQPFIETYAPVENG